MPRKSPKPVSLAFLARISLFWVGLSTLWAGLNIVYLPDRVETLVGSANKGTFLGILLSAGLIVAIVIQPAMGGLSDRSTLRWGRRKPFMLLGSLVSALFLLLMSAVSTYALLFAVVILLQLASNSAHGPYQGIIPDLIPRNQRGRASGFFGLANNLGVLLGALVAGQLLDRGQPGLYLFVAAVILVTVAVVSTLTIQEEPLQEKPAYGGVAKELRARLSELRARPGFSWILLSRLFFFMGLLAADQILLFFVRERLGMVENAGLYTTAALGTLLVVGGAIVVPAGWISDRMERRTLILISCCAGALAALILLFTTNYPMLLAGFAVLGGAVGIFVAADWALAIDLIPDPKAPGLYMGLTNLATGGGDALASLSAGVVLDTFNRIQPLLGYSAVFVMMAGFFVLGGATILKVPRGHADG
jgi:MFS family permease